MTESTKFQIPNSKQAPNDQIPSTKQYYDLEQRTLEFSRRVIQLCKKVKQDAINREIISQVVRSSGSVGANYREANEALSKKDFWHRIKIARKEAKEVFYWLQLIGESCPEIISEAKALSGEAWELRKILSAIALKAKK